MPIRVSVRAVFSKYALTPARGINFGPLTYNTTSKPRSFEITNLGACMARWVARWAACCCQQMHRCVARCVARWVARAGK